MMFTNNKNFEEWCRGTAEFKEPANHMDAAAEACALDFFAEIAQTTEKIGLDEILYLPPLALAEPNTDHSARAVVDDILSLLDTEIEAMMHQLDREAEEAAIRRHAQPTPPPTPLPPPPPKKTPVVIYLDDDDDDDDDEEEEERPQKYEPQPFEQPNYDIPSTWVVSFETVRHVVPNSDSEDDDDDDDEVEFVGISHGVINPKPRHFSWNTKKAREEALHHVKRRSSHQQTSRIKYIFHNVSF